MTIFRRLFNKLKKKDPMAIFNRITIHLEQPICDCFYDGEGPYWTVPRDHNNRPTLEVGCEKCGTKLIIGNDKFVARFEYKQKDEERLKYNEAQRKQQEDREGADAEEDQEDKPKLKVLEFPEQE